MRIFVGLDISDAVREQIKRFMEGVRGFAPDARWVRVESLHITLKFVGETSLEVVEGIKAALKHVKGGSLQLNFRGYGFFPNLKSARVFWVGVEASEELSLLANSVDESTAQFGVAVEGHQFSPHLTLARGGGSGSPHRRTEDRRNKVFQELRAKLENMSQPEFGTMTAREFYLYKSELSARGAQYTKIDRYILH